MNALIKANQMINARVIGFQERAGRMKEAGMLDAVMTPGDPLASWGGQTENRERYSRFRGVVYSAVNALALHACGQPVQVARKLTGEMPKGSKSVSPEIRRKMPASVRSKTADEVELLMDHPLVKCLEKPNKFQGALQFVYNYVANLNLTGKAYIVGGMGGEEKLELYTLPTTWVTPNYDDNSKLVGWRVGDPRKTFINREELKPNQVVCSYLPNPADPRGALAPAASQMNAIRVDDNIWQSREVFFDNNSFPGVIITVGKQPMQDTEGRPVLSGAQRRQLYAAINSQHSGVRNYGKPAIIDGLIERIDRMQMNSQEMGWEKSSKETKAAILSAFCVHPFVLGEQMAVGTQQAAVIWRLFFAKVNVFLGMLGNAITQFVNGMGGEEELLVWWEEKEYTDPAERWKRTMDLRRNNDLSQNEARAEAGLPPDEDHVEDRVGNRSQQIVALLKEVTSGALTRDQATAVLEEMGFPAERADRMVGEPLAPQTTPGRPGTPEEELAAAVKALRSVPLDVSDVVANRIVKESAVTRS